jgi:hypothetical protein
MRPLCYLHRMAAPAAAPATRRLRDLAGVGPTILADFAELGIRNVDQLARQDPVKLYDRLSKLRGTRMDPCVRDVFSAAVAHARNPDLAAEQRKWWYWSRVRKAEQAASAAPPAKPTSRGSSRPAPRSPRAARRKAG